MFKTIAIAAALATTMVHAESMANSSANATEVAVAAALRAIADALKVESASTQAKPQGHTSFIEAMGDWDLYSFALSWQPEFCFRKSYPGCSNPDDFWKTSPTIHGLWPDVSSGQYPSNCGGDAFDLSTATSGVSLADLQKYWPNVKANPDDSSYTSFWEHEWTTHGTCSGLDQATFFKTAIQMFINDPAPSFIGANYGKTVSASDLQDAYGGSDQVVLQCKGRFLSQVLTCWTKGADNVPSGRRTCPSHLLNEASCGDSITISRFQN